MRLCSEHTARGRDLGGRRQPASRGTRRGARAHAREPRVVLRAVGRDVGVPGAAEGPVRRRGRGARPGVPRRRLARWCGRSARARTSCRTSGRCAAGSSRTSRRSTGTASSSSAPAGCATSSSRCSCCSSCTVAATSRCAAPPRCAALQALIDGGYVGRRDGAAMEEAYEFLRTLEHRIQLHRLRRTHIVPDDQEDLRRIGRSMGFRHNPAESLEKEWQAQRRVGAAPAREALLPTAARGRRGDPDRRPAAHAGSGRAAAHAPSASSTRAARSRTSGR